jgi:hypothetical protein
MIYAGDLRDFLHHLGTKFLTIQNIISQKHMKKIDERFYFVLN